MENENKSFSLKKGGLIWTIWNLVESLLLIVMGVLTIINCDSDSLHQQLFIIISVFLIIGGSLRIIANFLPVIGARKIDGQAKLVMRVNMSYSMCVAGAFELALGIALLVAMTGQEAANIVKYITSIIVYFTSVLLIVAGASLIMFAIGFIVSKLYKLYMPIIEIVFGLATAALGVVILVLFSDSNKIIITILLIVVGILLVLSGLGEAIMTVAPLIKEKKQSRKQKKDEKAKETIDVESKDSEEKKDKKEKPIAEEEPLKIENKDLENKNK